MNSKLIDKNIETCFSSWSDAVSRPFAFRPLFGGPKSGDVVAAKPDRSSVGVFVDNFAAKAAVKDAVSVGDNIDGIVVPDVDGLEGTFEAQNVWSFFAN